MSGAPPVSEHADVVIVGAGLSGVGLAHHLQEAFPDKSYVILEAREAIGGTWDLPKMQFQLCTGEWRDDPSDRHLVACEDKIYTGKA